MGHDTQLIGGGSANGGAEKSFLRYSCTILGLTHVGACARSDESVRYDAAGHHPGL